MKNQNPRWSLLCAAVLVLLVIAQAAQAQRRAWGGLGKNNANFGEGFAISLNDDNEQLKLAEDPMPVPLVWVPADDLSILKINAEDGTILGRYVTSPLAPARGGVPDPYAIAVDKLGNCWVANRGHAGSGCGDGAKQLRGSITRIGIVVGGTRTNADGEPDPNGEYLKPPFRYNTCTDRDGDGLIRTSRGFLDVLSWNDFTGENFCGGVSLAEDECITLHTRIEIPFTSRTLAVDRDDNLWVGGNAFFEDIDHVLVDGQSGEFIKGVITNGCGGAGGIIDPFGTLWSTPGGDSGFVRIDTETGDVNCGTDLNCVSGFTIDPTRSTIWATCECCGPEDSIVQLAQDGTEINRVTVTGFGAIGPIVVDNFGHLWVSERGGDEVLHFAPSPDDPSELFEVGRITGFLGASGISVDTFGNIWVPESSGQLSRIDPVAGPITNGSGVPLGAVDLQIDLPGTAPESYGDMTGFVSLAGTGGSDDGIWNVVFDSETAGTPWGTASWDDEQPLGSKVSVFVRASDDRFDLPLQPFREVFNGDPFRGEFGRFIEVKARLQRFDSDETPTVFEVAIEAAECFLVIGAGRGDDTFRAGPLAHEFQTNLRNIQKWRPVLMEANPEFEVRLPLPEQVDPGRGKAGLGGQPGVRPILRKSVQVLMWNPRVFPQNPEQYSPGLDVSVWPDGTVTTEKFGNHDGIDLEAEIVARTPNSITLKIPFVVEGF